MYKKVVLKDSQITLIHIPVPKKDPRLHVSALFGAGSRDEKGYPLGIAHFLEHMMFRGSKNHPSFDALAQAFEWLGGEWNGQTGQEFTEYTYTGTSTSLGESLELFADFLKYPLLQDLEREKQVILREIDDELNEWGHSTDLDGHISSLFWPKTSMGEPIIGTQKTVQSTTLDDLSRFRNTFYQGANLILTVVSHGSFSKVKKLAKQFFSDYPLVGKKSPWNQAIPQAPFRGPKLKWVEHSDSQCHIALSFLCQGENGTPKERAAYEILSRILSDGFSSRLVQRLREERGFVYDISAQFSLHRDRGTLDIQTALQPDHLLAGLGDIFDILKNLGHQGPTPKELKKAKTRYGVDQEITLADPANIAFRLGWLTLEDQTWNPDGFLRTLKGISSKTLMEVCQRVFQPQNLALVILGPKDLDKEKKISELLAQGNLLE
jgi:predicted Zn-dependent peptidase